MTGAGVAFVVGTVWGSVVAAAITLWPRARTVVVLAVTGGILGGLVGHLLA